MLAQFLDAGKTWPRLLRQPGVELLEVCKDGAVDDHHENVLRLLSKLLAALAGSSPAPISLVPSNLKLQAHVPRPASTVSPVLFVHLLDLEHELLHPHTHDLLQPTHHELHTLVVVVDANQLRLSAHAPGVHNGMALQAMSLHLALTLHLSAVGTTTPSIAPGEHWWHL